MTWWLRGHILLITYRCIFIFVWLRHDINRHQSYPACRLKYPYSFVICFVLFWLHDDTQRFMSFTYTHYSVLPIPRAHFSPNKSWNTPIDRPQRRGVGVFCEFEEWPKFYLRGCCALCENVLHCTAIYWESIVLTKHNNALGLLKSCTKPLI